MVNQVNMIFGTRSDLELERVGVTPEMFQLAIEKGLDFQLT